MYSNQQEIFTEEKLDNNIIPTTKKWGIASAIVAGILQIFSGNIIYGLILAIAGIMSTLGLCIILEGFSTIIKLLRAISVTNNSANPTNNSNDNTDNGIEKVNLLKQLKELLDMGVINNNEYETEKNKILK